MLLLLSIGYMNNLVEPKYTKLQEIETYLVTDARWGLGTEGIRDVNNDKIRDLSNDEKWGISVFLMFLMFFLYSGVQESIHKMLPTNLQFI
jgi:hypothetical protein